MNNPGFQNNMMAATAANRGQVQQMLLRHYRAAQDKLPPGGWQHSVSAEERGGLALQFFTSFRLLKQEANEGDILRQSLGFETQTFMSSATKEQYLTTIRQKLYAVQTLRQNQLQNLGANPNNPMGAMNAAQMNMMAQGNPQPRQGTPQQMAQGFPNPQLRQAMQVSAIPMSQNPSSMSANGGNVGNAQPGPNNPQPNMQQGQANQQQQQQKNLIINRLTQRLMEQARPEARQAFQMEVNAWPEDKKHQLVSRGINPLLFRFRQQAESMLNSGKINRDTIAQLMNQQPNQMAGGMQQGQMQNQQMGANQRQPGQEFDFNALANQQSEAMRVQDQGQTVVPASNNNNNNGSNGNNNNVSGQMGNFAQGQQAQNAAMQQRQAAQAAAFQNVNANMQRQAAQAQAEARARQQMQQQQQQQQAMNTPNLNGQPGGLNRPLGTPNPNALNMLNRPMVPPGQPNPTTPQQRPQAHVPVMTPQPDAQLSQLMREAQQRAAQAAGVPGVPGQPLTEQARMQMIPPELDPMVKQQLLKVPEPQFRHILGQYNAGSAGARHRNMMPNGAFPGGQPPNGQPGGMMMNPNPNMGMGALANASINGQMMNNMRPGGLGQPLPMGARPMPIGQRPGIPPHQARLLQAQQTLQQNPGIISITDTKQFPPSALNDQIRSILPPDVKTWAQLKQWASSNPNLTPGVDSQKLLLLQVLHFQDLMKQNQQNQQNGMQGPRPPQPPNMGGMIPPGQMVPGGVPNRPPQQQQPNMPNLGSIQVTPQEMQQWRTRLPPHQANVSDEQLRGFIMQQKVNARKHQQQQQQAMFNMQRNPSQQPQVSMGGPVPQAPRPLSAQNPAAQANPQPKPPGQPSQPPQSNVPTAANKGVKRSNEESEGTADAQPNNAAPQAPAMVPSRSQQGLNLTQEQMSKFGPQQQAQMRANLMKAQDASNKQQGPRPQIQEELAAKLKDPERERKFRLILQQEENKLPKSPVVAISPEVRAKLQQLIHEKLSHIKKVEQALRIFLIQYEGTDSENLARTVIKARIMLLRQLNPQDGTLHPELTMTESEFQGHIRHILAFVGKVMSRMANQQAQAKPQQGQQQPQAQEQTAGTRPALNASNLKKHEQQQRHPQVPPAPTASQPPFQLGGASPSGAPIYGGGARNLTHLSLPEKKRQKIDPDSQTSTPPAKQSPHIGGSKGNSPDMKRQVPQAVQKPTFKCSFTDCEHSARGFDTQAELDTHINLNHSKIDDPVQYALDSMAEYVGVDPKTGQPKHDPAATSKPVTTAPRVPQQPLKSGQTPVMPPTVSTPVGQAVATPMTRVPTQTGMKGSPSTSLLKTPQTSGKVATPSTGGLAKQTPASITKPTYKESEVLPLNQIEIEEPAQPLVPASLFDFSYDDIYAVLDTNAPFSTLDLKDEDNSWTLRSRPSSPLNTPDSSSKDTPSTRQSDISENDNLQISLDIKDADMPEAWLNMSGDILPLDGGLSYDIQALGVTLPPMDNDDMMLFNPDMDLDSINKAMDSLGQRLDTSMLDMSA